MINIAILEDEQNYAEDLRENIVRYASEYNLNIKIKLFSNGMEFANAKSTDYDIIFLDINMPEINGIDIARHIRKTNDNVVLIFVTNLAQYAIEGYSVDAMDFILKPIQYSSLKFRLEKAITFVEKRKKGSIMIKTNRETVKLEVSDIYYVEANKHKLIYHTVKDNYEVWGSMAKIKKELEPLGFSSCSVSYLINLKFAAGIEGEDVIVNNERIKISRNNRKAFLDALALYYSNTDEA